MSSVNDVMKMAFFGPKEPEDLDALDLSALKSFEQRGTGWTVTLFDRGGTTPEEAEAGAQALADAIEHAAGCLGTGCVSSQEKPELTISGLSTGAANPAPAGICPPRVYKMADEIVIAGGIERDRGIFDGPRIGGRSRPLDAVQPAGMPAQFTNGPEGGRYSGAED